MPPRAMPALQLVALIFAMWVPVSTSTHVADNEHVPGESFGWRKHGASGHSGSEMTGAGHPGIEMADLDGSCTVDRVDVSQFPTLHDFHTAHRANGGLPVVVTGLFDANREFREMSHKDALLKRWGDATIVLSTANTHSYSKVTKTLREYVDEHVSIPQDLKTPGNETLYWFGDNDHASWSPHFEKYERPPLIPHDADVALSFGIGGANSGVPLHVHGPGFSETVIGRKRWWLAPPTPKPRFDPNATALEWVLRHSEKTKNHKDVPFLACTVHEGEAIYFPNGWWHLTLNLDESVFMSSFVNYAWVAEAEFSAKNDDAFEL
jgi:hypothetical protein